MSIVPKETIEVIAQSIGISNLSPDAAVALAPDVEYRMREIMQEAIKCMRHSRRIILTADDVDGALNLKNAEPIYGFASGGPLRFKKAIGHKDLFYIDDKDLDIKDLTKNWTEGAICTFFKDEVIEAPLPKAPLDTAVLCHWLAIEGVQPAIPENAPVEVIVAPPVGKRNDQKDDTLPIEVKLPVRHVLSKELQLYFDKICELTVRSSDSVLFKEALASLATDSGLHPLVPYFTCFVADEVSRGLSDLQLLLALMRVVWSLLKNTHVNIEPYLHQLMPAIVTCVVAKRLGRRLTDNHWELRDYAANLVASICRRFGSVYTTLQTRLTKQLINAFLNPKHSLATHYGAVQGLAALGPNVVRLLILPNLKPYLNLLEPEMLLEHQKNKVKRYEAWRVYGALLRASGQFISKRFKIFPTLSSAETVLKTSAHVVTTMSGKRKATTEPPEEQSPRKIIVGPTTATSTDLSTSTTAEPSVSTPSDTDMDQPPSSSSSDFTVLSKGRRTEAAAAFRSKVSAAALSQLWKDDFDSGQLLVILSDLFGEDLMPFIPFPEMFSFL